MRGTLELLCGPSGVGKTSSVEDKLRAYTYTTRPRREKEIEGKDRRFVDDSGFERLLNQGEIVAPYSALGHRYGFAADLKEALKKGEQVSEQIVPYEAIGPVFGAFKRYGTVKKRLFVAFPQEIERRMIVRSAGNLDEKRILAIRDSLRTYIKNFVDFDEIVFNCIFLEFYQSEFSLVDRFFSAMWRESLEHLNSIISERARAPKRVIDYLVENPQHFCQHEFSPYKPAFLATDNFKKFYQEIVQTAKRRREYDQLSLMIRRAEDFALFRGGEEKHRLDLMTILEPYNRYQNLQWIVNDIYAVHDRTGIDPKILLPMVLPPFLKALGMELTLPPSLIREIYTKQFCKKGFYLENLRKLRKKLPKKVNHTILDLALLNIEIDWGQPDNTMVSGMDNHPPHGKSVFVIRGVNKSAGEIMSTHIEQGN